LPLLRSCSYFIPSHSPEPVPVNRKPNKQTGPCQGFPSTSIYAEVLDTCEILRTACLKEYLPEVYFDCGAKVDVVDVQGLILSPGFPYNYSSGTHCVWQFFVPVGHQLIMEMFDFDVFESHDSAVVDEVPNDGGALVSKSLGSPKEPQSTLREDVKQVVIQEQSTKMEMTKVSNSAKMLSDPPSPPQASLPVENRNSVSSQASRAAIDFIISSPRTATETGDAVSPETQAPLIDACPNDVLYISDLITFSSRFCGSRRPSSSQLVFGSDDDMVEVPEGVLNSAADVSELQMVSPNHLEQQPGATGSSVKGACDMSEKAALEQFSSGLTELELGTDEVFVIASAPISAHLPFSPHTGLPSTPTDSGRGKVLSDAPLHSPADSCQSDSFTSNASYPLTQPTQRQRRLNSTSNLRHSRFNAPCFGLLESSKAQANGLMTPNTLSDTSQLQVKGQISSLADDHVTVPVFAISEEEDRQPLVSEEHPEKPSRMKGQMFEGAKMPLLSKSQAPSIHPSSLVRGGRGGASGTQHPSALSC
ncbi:hypothetical protein cypCar_00009782, partial [Cyprinus carpio]